MYNGKAAENELRPLAELSGGSHLENDLIRHNLVVFRNGESALQVLPPLGDVPPEARLNLVIHHLRHGEVCGPALRACLPACLQKRLLLTRHACMHAQRRTALLLACRCQRQRGPASQRVGGAS